MWITFEALAGMAEWTIATVCKTVVRKDSEGSNPSPSTPFTQRINIGAEGFQSADVAQW